MKCPVCDRDLRAAEREGVELDYCPHCYGIWLDQDELEQLIERSNPVDRLAPERRCGRFMELL